MGADGGLVARDAYGFSLSYFNGDYQPIGTAAPFAPVTVGGNLYNGNIKAMAVNLPQLGQALVYGYGYDQLNRLVAMDAYKGLDNTANTLTPVALDDGQYRERITYDGNGNILTYNRNGDADRIKMDSLLYTYVPGTNRLDRVADFAQDAPAGIYEAYNDIKTGQQAGNYQYDKIGNLIKDDKEDILEIDWTVYGKIKQIRKRGGILINYRYDAAGNRIFKREGVGGKETWYVRDAGGNVMSVYTKDPSQNSGHLTQSEIHLYGSSRLGIFNTNTDMEIAAEEQQMVTFTKGNKFFELSNHLGNVLATVSDKKFSVDTNGDGMIDYYTADVVSANDYYPFGMMMPGRRYSAERYRYGFNGKELDKETTGTTTYDYGFRIYNPGLGRFLSVDPLTKEYPELTPYQFASNMPILAIDLDGLEAANYWASIKAEVLGVESLKLNNIQDVTDIQFQQYRLIIKNPTASVGQLYNKVVSDIGSIYNTDYGKFKYEKKTLKSSLTAGDYIRIDPAQKGLADIFVKVVSVNVSKDENGSITSFDYQFRTLEGHVEVGTIGFSARTMSDASGNSFLHFMIESTSQVDPVLAQIISGFSDNIRNQQIDNWSQTMGNILKLTGGEKQEASVYVETYENGILNRDFKRVENNPNMIGEAVKYPKKVEQRNLPAAAPGS